MTVYSCISITPPRDREVTELPQRFAGSWLLMLNAVKFLFLLETENAPKSKISMVQTESKKQNKTKNLPEQKAF